MNVPKDVNVRPNALQPFVQVHAARCFRQLGVGKEALLWHQLLPWQEVRECDCGDAFAGFFERVFVKALIIQLVDPLCKLLRVLIEASRPLAQLSKANTQSR